MSSPPDCGMGRASREQTPRDGAKSESGVEPHEEEGPMDLSMPRYPSRKKDSRAANSYFAAGRRKPPPSTYDVDVNEQPIDYSKKYVESNSLSAVKTNYVPRNSLNKVKIDHREREKGFSQQDNKAYPYGVYAETDLDQPTDYSLRYAEDDTDDEEKQNDSYFNGNEQEDTVKTYCTEGTPYETPFNVSSATSMSDLRLEEAKDGDGSSRRAARRIIQDSRKDPTTKQPPPTCEEQENEEQEEEENEILTKESKNISNELVLNSSSASIEKPVNYYDEGTPGRMSRVSSLSSLGCTNEPRNEDVEETREDPEVQTTPALPVSPIPMADGCEEEIEDAENSSAVVASAINDEEATVGGPDEEKGDARVVDKEGKVVTFGGEDHYAEQTPLMFSRSSSLGSLSGFEQQSIHDDRSSIVSDFSRRTSGVVSPSELPDSPTQTVPPSPRHNQKNHTNDLSPRAPPLRQFSYVKSPRAKSSVFEDNVTAFKEESTPLEFSAATSLSSLTIDDEPKILMDTKEKDYPEEERTVESFLANSSAEVATVEDDKSDDNAMGQGIEGRENDRANQEQGSDGDEDDEDILAACISMGMRNSMYKQSCNKITEIPENVGNRISTGDTATNLVRHETSSTLDRLAAGVAAVSLSPDTKTKNSIGAVAVPVDTIRVYCTEDTPANISPVGSQSNLSALSMLSMSGDIEKDDRGRLSDEDDDDKILDDCIRAGIARTLQGANSFPGTAVVTEFNSPSHASLTKKCQADDKALDDCLGSGMAKNSPGSNSFPGTAAATKHPSPRHVPSMKESELYMPRLLDSPQAFPTSSPTSAKSDDPSTSNTPVLTSLSAVGVCDRSACDDHILEECARTGMARPVHGADAFPGAAAATDCNSLRHESSTKKCQSEKILDSCMGTAMTKSLQESHSFPGTAVATQKHHSPHHVPSLEKPEVDLARLIDSRQAFSETSAASVRMNNASLRRASSAMSNPIVAEHDASGDDDKILDDCIRAGIARTLGGAISFASNATVTNHQLPHRTASPRETNVHVLGSVDDCQAIATSASSLAEGKLHSATFERTSVDEDKILEECIRAGMARTMHGTNSFPGTAAATGFNSPTHGSSTKEYESDKNLDDCTRIGMARGLQESNSFPGTAAATKSEVHLSRLVDSRQAFSRTPSVRMSDAVLRQVSSAASKSIVADRGVSGDDDVILDDCIKAGIARTLGGAASFPSKATVTKPNSLHHAASPKKTKVHVLGSLDDRQAIATSKSPLAKGRSPSTSFDHDTLGDKDKILEECIRAGMARAMHEANSLPGTAAATGFNSPTYGSSTKRYQSDKILDDCIRAGIVRGLQESNSFPGTALATKHHSPRHVSALKKPEVHLSKPIDLCQAFSRTSSASSRLNDASLRHASSAMSNSIVADHDTSADDDKILDDCIRAGIARTLGGAMSFASNATVTKHHLQRPSASSRETKAHVPGSVDNRQAIAGSKSFLAKGKSHSTTFDHDTSGDEDKILDECIRAGMARTMHGTNSFPGSAAATKLNSPRHTISTGPYHDGDRIWDDRVRSGVTRTPHGSNSFPGTPVATKQNSPRHTSSKKPEAYLQRPIDTRPLFSAPSPSAAKRGEALTCRTSFVRPNLDAVDHDGSGTDDKILDACIEAGIARTLQGAVLLPNAATKLHSPRHVAATKKSEVYLSKSIETRQTFPASAPFSAQRNDSSIRNASSGRSNTTIGDFDPLGDDDKILDECIKVGIARTLHGVTSFPSSAAATQPHSPRRVSSTKKSDVHLSRTLDTRQATSTSSPTKTNGVLRTSSPRLNSAVVNQSCVSHDESPNHSEDEAILTECIQSAMPKACRIPAPFSKPQVTRIIPKPVARCANLHEASTRVTTEVFRTSVTTILIPAVNGGEESLGGDSSVSEGED